MKTAFAGESQIASSMSLDSPLSSPKKPTLTPRMRPNHLTLTLSHHLPPRRFHVLHAHQTTSLSTQVHVGSYPRHPLSRTTQHGSQSVDSRKAIGRGSIWVTKRPRSAFKATIPKVVVSLESPSSSSGFEVKNCVNNPKTVVYNQSTRLGAQELVSFSPDLNPNGLHTHPHAHSIFLRLLPKPIRAVQKYKCEPRPCIDMAAHCVGTDQVSARCKQVSEVLQLI